MRFEHITVREGLPENSVSEIIQDYQGFLWFATQYGPVKYDGYKFTIYKFSSQNSQDTSRFSVYSLFEDKTKDLWIGTECGLSRYNREKDILENFSIGNDFYLIYSICEDDNGFLYFGSEISGTGLYKFDKVNKTYTKFLHNPTDSNSIGSNLVKYVFKEDSETIWIGTFGGGLNKFDIRTNTFRKFKNIPGNNKSISSDNVYSIYKDKSGNLWIGTDHGLNKFNNSTETFRYYSILPEDSVNLITNLITDIKEDNSGYLWLTVSNYGLVKFEPESGIIVRYKHEPDNPYSLCGNFLESIFEDRSGVLWIGCFMEGLDKYDRQKSEFLHFNKIVEKNSSDFVWSFLEDSNKAVWIGTSNGLCKFDKKSNSFINFDKINKSKKRLTSKIVNNLLIDHKGLFWIGTRDGLNKYDTKKGTLSQYLHIEKDTNSISNSRIYCIFEDNRNNLWFGTIYGLNLYDRENDRFKTIYHDDKDTNSISDNNIICIYEDRNNDLWFGTNFFGLNKYNHDEKTFKCFYNPVKGLSTIGSIYEDNRERFWIGTYMTGLCLFDRDNGEIKTFSEDNGLVYNSVTSVLEDNSGYLWIGTSNGLSRFNPETYEFKNFDKNDLPVTRFWKKGLIDKDGFLYFGGDGGFIMFHPDSIKNNEHVPQIVLTDFKLSNISIKPDENSPLRKNINIAEEINLTYKENDFSLEFAALDFHNPMKNKYAYKLEGFNPDWIYTDAKNRTATYTNLDPGEYTFLVKGSNNDGVWNEKGTSIKIIITPPFWITWWFRGIYIILFAGIIGFIWQRKHSKVQKELQKQKEFTKQLIESQELERKRIAGELHDSLGQNLLLIKNKLLSEIKMQNENPKLTEISELTSETIQDVRTISYNLHPYQLEQLGLTKAIHSIINRASESTNIKFESEVDKIDKLFSPETEINFFRIIQECINNIVKHSKATEAHISVLKKPEEVSVEIQDNGIGFDLLAVKSKPGLGLRSLKERADLCNAKVETVSSPGKGTLIKISVLINNN